MTLLFTLLLLINFIITYKSLKDEYYEKNQKTIQLFIIWIIPVIGALLVYLFLHKEKKQNKNNSYVVEKIDAYLDNEMPSVF